MSENRARALQTPQARQAQVQFWSLWGLAGLAVFALVLKILLNIQNAGLERDAVEKQQFINQTMPVSRLNVQLVQGIANVAARTGDPELEKLLAGQGIQFEVKNR